MRRFLVAAPFVALALLGSSSAALAANTPVKADKQTIPQVAAYKACTSTPLTDAHAGLPACAAVRNNANYKFGPKGIATSAVTVLKAGAKVKDISGKDMIPPQPQLGSTGPDIQIITTATDILLDSGTGITGNQQGFVWTRITDQNCGATPLFCTLGDLPFPISHGPDNTTPNVDCNAGVCSQATTGNLVVENVFHAGIPAIVAGVKTNLQVGSACIRPTSSVAFPLPGAGVDATCQGVVVGKLPKTGLPTGFYAPAKSAKMVYPFVGNHKPQTDCALPRTNVGHAPPLSFSACQPAEGTTTSTAFGPKGSGTVTLSAKKGKAAKPPTPEVLGDVLADIKAKGIVDGSNAPKNGLLEFKTTVRVTHADCAGVPCTRDQAVSIPVTCVKGKCGAKKAPLNLKLPGDGISNVEIATQRNQPGTTPAVPQPDNCLYDGAAAFACTGLFIP